jgi:hypothetical protein
MASKAADSWDFDEIVRMLRASRKERGIRVVR